MDAAKSPITVILEVGMHCESCASKIILCSRGLKGVETVTVDIDSNKLILVGEVDPLKIQEDLCRKINKKVDLVSPQPKNVDTITTITDDNNKNGMKSNEERLDLNQVPPLIENQDTTTANKDYDRKSNEKNTDIIHNKPYEATVITMLVLKLGHYCQGCDLKIRKTVSDTNGLLEMAVDEEKEIITIKGAMDAKLLVDNLKEKLSCPVDILSLTKEEYSSSNGKDSENVSDDGKKKNWSDDDTEMKPEKSSATMTVFKVPLHCDGCAKRIRKIIKRIIGVQEVRIDKEKETVTVISTIDVKALTETMKKRLKKLVEDQKIEIKSVIKATSQYAFDKKAPKHQSCPQPALQLSEEQSEIIEVISVHHLNDEGMNLNQSPVSSSGDAHTKLDSEIGESLSTSETLSDWCFLIASLFLEGVSAVLDQFGYLLAGMVLAFVALLLSTVELIDMARRDGLVRFDRISELPCYYCRSTDKTSIGELFSVVHCFGLTCAVWQCLFSTVQYIYALRHLDNPIRMSLLPFIFLLCVLISKLIRKMEEINCQNLNRARAKVEPESVVSLSRRMEQNGQTLKSMDDKPQVPSDSSEPLNTTVSQFEFCSGDFGCSHYRRRCKIRAPCCNDIFYCSDCHNEAKNSLEISPDARHHISHHEVIQVICSVCGTEQDVRQNCISCEVCMGKYFCGKCKIFDDDVSKNQYHCDECGICRNGGRENFFHCKNCRYCYPKTTEDAHHCMETRKAMNQD